MPRSSWRVSINTISANIFINIIYIISLSRDLVAELPFILMHPKPEEETLPSSGYSSSRRASKELGGNNVPVDANLIQLDA